MLMAGFSELLKAIYSPLLLYKFNTFPLFLQKNSTEWKKLTATTNGYSWAKYKKCPV